MDQVSPGFMLEIEIQAILNELEPKLCGPDLPKISEVLSTSFRYLEGRPQDVDIDNLAANFSDLWRPSDFEPTSVLGTDHPRMVPDLLSSIKVALQPFESVEYTGGSTGASSCLRAQSDCTTEEYITGILGERFVSPTSHVLHY